ncbi:zinc finger BED domain-containing protein 1-like [Astyanax mexicanus]|uniref:Zinc finger BED domain-containing protein 1-like n=1 Tax=Astyanax mexicanus TaxID=7994 RepID=A0A8T2MAV9_ASTMX|nr:zinc finger BED domain-containing protein 1-like [Astyanax mexicanus]
MEDLVQKKGVTSPIWQYFGFQADEHGEPLDINAVKCRLCRKSIMTKDGNTSNLRAHLRIHHPNECAKLGLTKGESSSSSQPSIIGAFAKCGKYKRDSAKWQECTTSVTRYLVKGLLPFNTVEKSSFTEMLQTLNSQYELPGRKYFSKTAVPDMYNSVRAEVEGLIKKADFYSLTTDMWSSTNMTPYMSLTAHFISPQWELQSKCLETVFFPESHTATNIAEGLRSVIQDWNLNEEKISCITTDNAANIKSAVRNELGWQWLNCFGHNLHLAVTNSVKKQRPCTDRALGVCQSVIGTFSHSWQKKRALLKAQQELQLPEHSLITDCATRWGSKQKMIERIIEQAPAIGRVLAADRRAQSLTWQDLDVLEAMNKALKPIADFTDILSGEDYVTVSSLLPTLLLLKSDTLSESEGDVKLTKDIKCGILTELESKYDCDSTKRLMCIATFLDPRFRGERIAEDDLRQTKTEIHTEMVKMMQEQGQTGESMRQEDEPPAKKKTLGSYLSKAKPPRGSFTEEERATAELTIYEQEPTVDGDDDPLAWWRTNSKRLPIMARLARKYLCVCATSTPSERVFSTAGNVVSPSRSHLKPDKVNMLVFLAKNA